MNRIDRFRVVRPLIKPAPKRITAAPARPVERPQSAAPKRPAAAPQKPATTPAPVTPERKAQIESWLRENATATNRHMFFLQDSDGGSRVGQALRGESDLGRLNAGERDLLAQGAVQAWREQDNAGGRLENIREAVDGVGDGAGRSALARALARPELDAQAVYARGGTVITPQGDGAIRHEMLQQALRIDPAAVMREADGLAPQLASTLQNMPASLRGGVWSVLADRTRLDPAQAERMATAAFMFEDGKALGTPQARHDFAAAIANARAPGADEVSQIRRQQITHDLETALSDRDTREMLFAQNTPPELRVWALGQLAGDGRTSRPAEALKGGWESEGISRAFADRATDPFRARGAAPQELSGEALRNTVGQAMGLAPDALPQGELTQEWLDRGLQNRVYSQNNPALDEVADQIRAVGGDAPRVTVVPVTLTTEEKGAAVVPVFRVEDPQGGAAKFVDHTGRSYRDLKDWEDNNTLPKGKMTYVQGLDLSSAQMEHRNTPGVVDSFGEGLGKVVDGIAIGAGIVAGVALIAGTGGTATPLVVAGAAGLWGAGRAGQELHDKATHGEDISDLSDPAVRGNWLEVAAGALSVGAIGGALKLGAAGARVTPGMARMVVGVSYAADAADALTVLDQSVQLGQNWDKLSGGERAGALLNIAFWGGMGAASHMAGARGQGFGAIDADMRVRGMAGNDVPVAANGALAPGEVRVAYDLDAEAGRATNIHIETGPGAINPQALDLHRHVADQMRAAGGLRDRLNGLLGGKPRPEVGSAAWEARLEIDKIEAESLALARAARDGSIDPAALATRQRELDQALIREERRLDVADTMGKGFVAAPKSLEEIKSYYAARGDIELGVPAGLPPLEAPAPDAVAHIDYGHVNAADQAQGIQAIITKEILGTGTKAGSYDPPGFRHGRYNHSRGHLLARMLGGSGSDPRNLVMLYQRDANSPVMSDFEIIVHDAAAAGEAVNYKVTPIYTEGQEYPTHVALQAKGSKGLDIEVTIVNRNNAE